MEYVAPSAELGALWASLLQTAVGRASHEVKDALNGVSVNVEVIRGRTSREGVAASALAPFADAASQQIDRLVLLIEAVLGLSRMERTPVDIGLLVGRAAVLLSAAPTAGAATVAARIDADATVSALADGTAARVAVFAPLLQYLSAEGQGGAPADLHCVVTNDDAYVRVVIEGGAPVVMPHEAIAALSDSRITWSASPTALAIAFPRV